MAYAALACMLAGPAIAETHQPDRAALMSLARKFVKQVGQGLETADQHLQGKDPSDIRMQPFFDALPDGEPMVMVISLKKDTVSAEDKMTIEQPVTGIKQGHDVMISLTDFVYAANFPIIVDPAAGIAEGWYIREEQKFILDLAKNTALSNGVTYNLAAQDVMNTGTDILVKGETLSRWLGFNLVTNPQTQSLNVTASQLWPIQEQKDRKKRRESVTSVQPPQKPFHDAPYSSTFSFPTADFYFRKRIIRTPNAPQRQFRSHVIRTTNEIAGHTAHTNILGSDRENIRNITLKLTRKSEEEDLLGPLKARQYELNDVSTTSIPFAGSAPQERGIRVTNRNPNITYNTTTTIDGSAPPGWDVELFREEQYVASAITDDTGFFAFPDIRLFAGDNRFTIIKYGPQGEVEEEKRQLAVSSSTLTDKGNYDASLSLQNMQTYSSTPSTDEDKGTPRLSLSYQKQLTSELAAQHGLKMQQESGRMNAYLHNGAVLVKDGVIYNADSVLSARGPFLAALTARKNFNNHHRTATTVQYTARDYNPNRRSNSNVTPASFLLSGAASGPLDAERRTGNYEVSSTFTHRDIGENKLESTLNLSKRFNRMVWNNFLKHSYLSSKTGTRQFMEGSLSARGRAATANLRATLDYNISPRIEAEKLTLDARKNLTRTLQGQLTLEHQMLRDYSTAEASLNWRAKHATITPTVSYDSNDTMNMLMNVHFGLARDPYNGKVIVSGTTLTDKAGLSAFVYLDKNGDNTFSEGDEPIPDAVIEAVHLHRSAFTNEDGEAFINDLPTRRVTDIILHDSSAFDINWVAGHEGISVRPRQGHITRIEFPVHRGGEISGIVRVKLSDDQTREMGNLRLHLHNGDGKLIKTAVSAFDGFYLFERVPPGTYFMTVNQYDAETLRLVRPMPQVVHLDYTGTIIPDNDITMRRGEKDIPLSIAPDLSAWIAANPSVDVSGMSNKSLILNLGQYHSRLLTTVMWYKMRIAHGDALKGATLMVMPSDSNIDTKTGMNTLRALLPENETLEQALERCQTLHNANFNCRIEFIPTGLEKQAAAEGTRKG